MKKIILATDFSAVALNAANYATEMALAIDADLILLHVYNMPVSYSELPVTIDPEELKQDAEKEMHKLKAELYHISSHRISIDSVIRMGSFTDELEYLCDEVKPYAVVLGSIGKSETERMLFGSNTVHTMKKLDWPLIAVPKGVKFSSIKKIGFACDFDNVVESTPVDEIEMLVKDFNAELHILNIGKNDTYEPQLIFESGLLQEMLASLAPVYHFVTNKNTDEGIIEFTEKNNIDLLIVLPKQHTLLDKLVHKSHTKYLVLHSHVPVMALHQ